MLASYHRLRAFANTVLNDRRSPYKRGFDACIYLLIIVSVGLLAYEFSTAPDVPLPPWETALDHAILYVFAAEYLGRLWVIDPKLPQAVRIKWRERLMYHLAARLEWAAKPMNLVDLVAILPLFPFLRSLRVLRLLRLVAKAPLHGAFRYFDPFAAAGQTFRSNRLMFVLVWLTTGLAIFLGAAMIFVAEHRTNPKFETAFDAVWWAVVTITTVGYGDIYPETAGGRVIGIVLMLTGFFLFALFAGAVSQTFVQTLINLREEGLRMTTMVNQIVVCGWNNRSLMLLHELHALGSDVYRRVVVFAELDPPPGLPDWVTFVKGDPTQEVELSKVRMEAASAVIVVADERAGMSFSDADARTLLTVFTLRSFESKLAAQGVERTRRLHLTAELFDPDNVAFVRSAGADEVIETARLGTALLASTAATWAGATRFTELVSGQNGLLTRVPVQPGESRTFGELLPVIKREHDALLVGYEREGKLVVNPAAGDALAPGDTLLLLTRTPHGASDNAAASFWGPLA